MHMVNENANVITVTESRWSAHH